MASAPNGFWGGCAFGRIRMKDGATLAAAPLHRDRSASQWIVSRLALITISALLLGGCIG